MTQRKWTVVLLYPNDGSPYVAHVEGETWLGAEWKARLLATEGIEFEDDIEKKQYLKAFVTVAVFSGYQESEV